MTASKAVAERGASKVPDLVRTPALSIGADDIALSRIYVGQYMSAAVQEGLVKPGQIFSATGGDDPDPQVLWSPGDEDGVVFYVLILRKGKSVSEGGELQLFDFDDPNAPAEAWTTYNYTVALPHLDTEVPYKLLLTRTGRAAALQINTVLKKGSIKGPAWLSAFSMTAVARENAKGKFFVARVAQVEANQKHVEAAEQLGLQMSSVAPVYQSSSEEPAI